MGSMWRHKPRYTDEQKLVAVEHYLNHGCCLAFTEKFMQQVDAYICWYNERHIKLSLGTVSPAMYRQAAKEIVRIPGATITSFRYLMLIILKHLPQ